jgi:hypothetical protein
MAYNNLHSTTVHAVIFVLPIYSTLIKYLILQNNSFIYIPLQREGMAPSLVLQSFASWSYSMKLQGKIFW